MKRLVFTIALIGLASIFCSRVGAEQFEKDLVPDGETAIKIAAAVMEAYRGHDAFESDLNARGLAAMLEGDEWIVCHCQGFEDYPKIGEDSIVLPGNVGLTVKISRFNGEITYLAFDD